MDKSILKENVINKLKEVIDWEIGLDVVRLELGRVVNVDDSKSVQDLKTITNPMCPLAGAILSDAESKVKTVEGIGNVGVELTFDPPWTPDRIDPAVRKQLGI